QRVFGWIECEDVPRSQRSRPGLVGNWLKGKRSPQSFVFAGKQWRNREFLSRRHLHPTIQQSANEITTDGAATGSDYGSRPDFPVGVNSVVVPGKAYEHSCRKTTACPGKSKN